MENPSTPEKLVKARGNRTCASVAKDLKVSYSAMRAYEHGWRRPRDSVKKKIADYYGMTVQELFY